MVDPKKQDFWPKNQYTQRRPSYFEITGNASASKILENKVVQKLKLEKKNLTKNGLLN